MMQGSITKNNLVNNSRINKSNLMNPTYKAKLNK